MKGELSESQPLFPPVYEKMIGRVSAAFVFCLLALSLTSCPAAFAQTGEWAWMSGSKTAYQNGVYGELGVAAKSNVPGARENAVSWIDASGNLWLFGGTQNCNGCYWGPANDLWRYSPATGYWTWMSGSNQSGQPGIYGTQGIAAPANVPGARDSAISWIDSNGNLWLFGGEGYDSAGEWGELNDLWEFTSSTGDWTWMSGSSTIPIQTGLCQPGLYGTLGVANSNNVPGGRLGAGNWTYTSGNLWLFGGYGCDSTGNEDELNDLWKYAPSTNQWTWISGSNIAGQSGKYGTLGSPSSSTVPGGRQSAAAWIDSSGTLWLFGGYGYDSTGDEDELNDLWKFIPSTGQWTWTSGSDLAAQPGIYGTLGSASSSNVPGGRQNTAAWIDSGNDLWLFGGNGYDSQGMKKDLTISGNLLPPTANGPGWAETQRCSTEGKAGRECTENWVSLTAATFPEAATAQAIGPTPAAISGFLAGKALTIHPTMAATCRSTISGNMRLPFLQPACPFSVRQRELTQRPNQ
jgi:N-acetylneuraminic acid mutarotase